MGSTMATSAGKLSLSLKKLVQYCHKGLHFHPIGVGTSLITKLLPPFTYLSSSSRNVPFRCRFCSPT